jgi:anti-anti-sigma regulatory factor
MKATTFIDSITIGALVAARQEGRVLTLRSLKGEPLKALERSGITGMFATEP